MNNRLMNLCLGFLMLFAVSAASAQNKPEFCNPILAGFYPDPSICRVGSDYYLVCSSFSYFPGIPIFQSKDLVNWKQIGHVMDRPEQLNLDSLGVSRGIFAPAIRYNKGLYYLTCTLVDKGGNFVVTAKRPEGPWSNPIWLPHVNGIDPSLFFDDDGKAYILYNSIPPDDKPLYDGHRTIRMRRFDAANLKVVSEEKIIINGGVDISKKPIWIEAPHIFKVGRVYYLIAAEGGTAGWHSEVVFRSTNAEGPYVPYEKNPILTQRTLDPQREFPVTSTGHADLVQMENGTWWAVFLGCRPYRPFDQGYYNTGRETFLAPVAWRDGWPIINPDLEKVQYHYPLPIKLPAAIGATPHGGNIKVRDEFFSGKLDFHWELLRTPRERWYSLSERKGLLAMRVRPETCSDPVNPSFVGRRQQHLVGSASVRLEFVPAAENEKAGMLVFQNEKHFYYICKSVTNGLPVVQLYKSTTDNKSDSRMDLLVSREFEPRVKSKAVLFKIEAHGNTYSFSFAVEKDKWILLSENVDATFLSTRIAKGFVGCMYALYATSLGKSSGSTAYFDWFESAGNDEVY
ncbi:MAG: glycoside hydrolase family 43 protein [Ignavibacteriales bacterium]|nr:glycoside hydrolase family 43 protein [Ignavibacteriales bacterium]